MEAFFIRAGQLLLCLSILVILHELGHFIPAKLFKTRVEKFFLFFEVCLIQEENRGNSLWYRLVTLRRLCEDSWHD